MTCVQSTSFNSLFLILQKSMVSAWARGGRQDFNFAFSAILPSWSPYFKILLPKNLGVGMEGTQNWARIKNLSWLALPVMHICLIKFTGKLQSLSEIRWYARVSWLVLCCVVWRRFTIEKYLNFDGLSGQEKIWQHILMSCSKIGHSNEAFTYLFGQYIFIHLLSANNMLKYAVTGTCNFRLIRDSTNKLCKKMNSLKPRITDQSQISWDC